MAKADNNFSYSGLHGHIAEGYHVKLPDIDPLEHHPTGYLTKQDGARVGLWLTEVTASFSMGGNYVQRRNDRTFYPRNLQDPTFTLTGVVANSFEYNRLAEFVYASQSRLLRGQGSQQFMNLTLTSGGSILTRPGNDNRWKTPDGTITSQSRGTKGPRQSFNMNGYIQNVRRGAERFINAPTYTIEFIVMSANGNSGLYLGKAAAGSTKVLNWTQIEVSKKFQGNLYHDPKPKNTKKKITKKDPVYRTPPNYTRAGPLDRKPEF